MLNASREAIVITMGYVRQSGAKEDQTVGVSSLYPCNLTEAAWAQLAPLRRPRSWPLRLKPRHNYRYVCAELI